MKNNYKNPVKMTNAIDPAATTARSFGFHPIPCKGGKTTNYDEAMTLGHCHKAIREGE